MRVDDLDLPQLAARYRWCRTGFGLCALACGAMAFHYAGSTAALLLFDINLLRYLNSPGWLIGIRTTIAWSVLAGSLALWPCWEEVYWRRRVGAMIAASLVIVCTWLAYYAPQLGIGSQRMLDNELVFSTFWIGVRWVWLAMVALLAGEVGAHLGEENAPKVRAGVQATMTVSFAFWIMTLLADWMPLAGLAPGGRRRAIMANFMQGLGFNALYCAVSFSTTVLLLMGARQCRRLLRELKEADGAFGPQG